MKSPALIKRFILLILLLAGFAGNQYAQDYFCATPVITGEVFVYWHDGDFSNTVSYEILVSTDPSFATFDSYTRPATSVDDSYLLPNTNGLLNRYYIKIIVHTATGQREAVISNILLKVTEAVPGNPGIARLSWNPVSPALQGNFLVIAWNAASSKTLASIPAIPAVTDQQYIDTLSYPFCDSTDGLIYWIRFLQNGWTDCQSNSNNVHKSYYDNTAFDPVNDTVSINNNPALGEVLRPVIGWTPSPDKGTAGYIIYRYSQADGKFIPIDTIPSDSTYYIDKNVFACASPYTYALASIDSCGKVSPGTFIFAPHTITLNVDPIDPCERVANLSWNAYENMPGGLAGYRVYRQENNNPMVQLADVPPGHTTFTDNTGFRNGRNYKYMVRAYSATGLGTSTSCTIQVTYTGPVAPDTLYIEQASVVDDSYIRINCYSAPYGSVSKLVLERADPASGGSYLPVDTLVYTPPAIMPQHVAFNDSSVNVDAESYTYRLRFIDTCQSALPPSWSNSGSSILLNCMPNSANGNDLEWNDYSEWINPVLGYDIYRTVDKVPDPVGILAAVGPSVNSYTDPLEESLLTSEICYYIKASEAPGNPVVPDAASTSNTACALRDPAVFVPSAFAPYGQNRSFKPVVSQIAPRSFYMRIYNKWGQMIFETYDQRYGWNGKVDGVMSSCDVYAYYITYRSGAGREYAKRGTFVLVK